MDTSLRGSSPLARASITYACRLVDKTRLSDMLAQTPTFSNGQIALAEVTQITPRNGVVLADGHAHRLWPNTTLLVALGEVQSALGRSGSLPEEMGLCSLLSPYGVAGIETSRGAKSRGAKLDEAIQLRLLGSPLKLDGSVATLADFAASTHGLRDVPQTYLFLGCANNVGETQALLNMTAGLRAQAIDNDVAVILLGDWQQPQLPANLFDAGATHILDAGNLGLAHTHTLVGEALWTAVNDLCTLAALRGARHCLIALGGGYNRPEMRGLLANPQLAARIDGVMLAAADALSARTVALDLQAHGLPLLGLSGTLANSPLASREAQPLNTPIIESEKLSDPVEWRALMAAHYSRNGARHAMQHNHFN